MLQSEPLLLGTPLGAQSSELGIPVVRRGGEIARPSEERGVRSDYGENAPERTLQTVGIHTSVSDWAGIVV